MERMKCEIFVVEGKRTALPEVSCRRIRLKDWLCYNDEFLTQFDAQETRGVIFLQIRTIRGKNCKHNGSCLMQSMLFYKKVAWLKNGVAWV